MPENPRGELSRGNALWILGVLNATSAVALFCVASAPEHSKCSSLGALAILCGGLTISSRQLAHYLKILVAAFSIELSAVSVLVIARAVGLQWTLLPSDDVLIPAFGTACLFVAMARVAWMVPVARRSFIIADHYFRDQADVDVKLFGRLHRLCSEQFLAACALVTVVLLNQLRVVWHVELSYASTTLANSLQVRDHAMFWHAILVQLPIYLAPYVAATLVQFAVSAVLFIRWRRSLTYRYEGRWLKDHTHYRMTVGTGRADNPDQRIQEDVPRFIDGNGSMGLYNFTLDLIEQMGSFIAYATVLWQISADVGRSGTIAVPGALLWATVLYAGLNSALTVLVGRGLSALIFAKQHYEADFRFGLGRIREYTEQIALLKGEAVERNRLDRDFGAIVSNFYAIIVKRSMLTAVVRVLTSVSPYAPYLMLGALFFSSRISFATLTLATVAFSQVNGCLTYFVSYYAALADFRSSVDRLVSLDDIMTAAAGKREDADRSRSGQDIVMEGLIVRLPDGRPISGRIDVRFIAGQHVVLRGPSGCGKSTIFRILGGIWPHWSGRIIVPDADMMVLPQRVYLPNGTLEEAICYPLDHRGFTDPEFEAALADVGLGALAAELKSGGNWMQRLSGGEQQRLGFARALLCKPVWLLLDEATSALDPQAEAAMYAMLRERLPTTTLVSIAHGPALEKFHDRVVQLNGGMHARVELLDNATVGGGMPAVKASPTMSDHRETHKGRCHG